MPTLLYAPGSRRCFLNNDNVAVGLLTDGLKQRSMSGWKDRVEELLYESESVEEVVDVDDARVVVTSHRIMAFTPEMDGENFTQAERPNVTAVETSSMANDSLAERALRYGIYGGLLVLAGTFINFERFVGGIEFDAEAAEQTGAGGLVGLSQRMIDGIALADELMQVVGALALLLAVAIFAVYWLLRTPTLAIRVAGDGDDIHVPQPDEPDLAATTLEQAIIPDEMSEESSGKLTSAIPDDVF